MPPLKPSVFTPFLRRFTDERARDLAETRALYNEVRARHLSSRYADENAIYAVAGEALAPFLDTLGEPLDLAICDAVYGLLLLEKEIFACPEPDVFAGPLSMQEAVDLRRYLRAKEHFLAHEEKSITILKDGLTLIFGALANRLPRVSSPSPFTIPLIYALPEPRQFIDQLYGTLWEQKYVENGLFVEVSRRMYLNLCEFSEIVDPEEPKRPFKKPTKNDAALDEIVETYLKGTPFWDFFLTPVPLRLTQEDRFSHVHVIGGSGAGKTTLLQNLIVHDLASDEPPSLVIVDSQGDLINKLSRLFVFDPEEGVLGDRLVLITPKDIDHPPAVNIFDLNRSRLGAYDAFAKEQVTAGVIQTFDYLFAGLLGADLTAKQGVFFRFVARLMLSLPETMGRNATILDMIALMDDPTPYRPAIESLPDIPRRFFEQDFPSKTFAQTKEQIRYRLHAILENPTLARLFTSPRTKIDLFDELNRGSVILVDTAKDFLKGASADFGRIFISLVLQAVLERAVIPEAERKPAFLIVDEAASYFDGNIDDLLTEARKYKLGCVFAHQFLEQCTPSLRASFAANTAIKFAGGVSTADARALAPEMRTTADAILSQPKLHFATYIRNVTPRAVSVPVPVGILEHQPKVSPEIYERLIERNRERVSLPRAPLPEQERPPSARAQPVQRVPEAARLQASEVELPKRDEPIDDEPAPLATRTVPGTPKRSNAEPAPMGRGGKQHKYLQHLIKEMAEGLGWRAVIEEPILDGAGRVDVSLGKEGHRIACEISVTTAQDHELGNVEKCLGAGYEQVLVVASNERRLSSLERSISAALRPEVHDRIYYLQPERLLAHLQAIDGAGGATEGTIRGYKVKVSRKGTDPQDAQARREAIAAVIARSLKLRSGEK